MKESERASAIAIQRIGMFKSVAVSSDATSPTHWPSSPQNVSSSFSRDVSRRLVC